MHDNMSFRLYVKYRLTHGVETQSKAFMKGFNELVPQHLIKMFDERELEVHLFLSTSLSYYQYQKRINCNQLFKRSMQKVNPMIHKLSSWEYVLLLWIWFLLDRFSVLTFKSCFRNLDLFNGYVIPANSFLFKVNTRNTRKRFEICSELTINFQHISRVFLLFLFFTLNM